MKFYPEDFNVEVIVGFTDLNGQPVTVTAVSAVLYDGEDQELVDFGSLPLDPGATEKSIVVPAAFNGLADGELRAPRILHIELTTAAGIIRRSFSYVIEAEQRLVIMTNTFMSFEAAEMLALDTPNSSGWTVSSEDQKKAALIEAFRRLTSLPMRFTQRDPDGNLIDECETVIGRDQWADIGLDEFNSYPSHFRKTLRRAQFIEANELLQGDNVGKKHRAGIVTEPIGESSVTLRAGRVDYGVGSQTLSALTGYLYFNMRIAPRMIPHRLSLEADAAAARYAQLIVTWQALYNCALSSDQFGYADQAAGVVREAYSIAETYFEIEKDHIARLLDEIASEAHQSVRAKISSIDAEELSDAALAHLAETQSYISDEIIAQIHRDIALMRQSLQRAVLDVSMMVRTRNVPMRRALIEYRIANSDTIEFTFTDRRARRTSSKIFIRALWRQTLLSAYNEIVLTTLADHGIDHAAVMKLEDGVVKQFDLISLSGESLSPTYGVIRNTYFHPNSNAWLEAANV